ncbi:Asp23/Gls24 family envelope stress response protein [Butyricicoccus sp.]|uniref:Asp23/Gls24 family envelope stress response protein n=1 Tax=Butyricicoccus sp. TaxID=2049021 RepID=UPI002A8DA8C4|nr:Asp23/Gls24 family envelope stress response protein [Butyricicoccus sp.]
MADSKEYWTSASDQGSVRISEDVIASIAAIAASETEGVGNLYSGIGTNVAEFLGKKSLAKGVKVVFHGDLVEVEVSLLAQYGYNICEVSKNVQSAVRSSIQSMTGMRTSAVNINVGGVSFETALTVPADGLQ